MPDISASSRDALISRASALAMSVMSSPAALRAMFEQPRRIAAKAMEEWREWDHGKLTESDQRARGLLSKYWAAVDVKHFSPGDAWSAVFITWIMQEAQAGSAFARSRAHRTYVRAAKRAKKAKEASKAWAFERTDALPEVGDLVVWDRHPGATLSNIEEPSEWLLHGDVVVAVREREVDVIGGNVWGPNCGKKGCTVNQKTLVRDPQGYLAGKQPKDKRPLIAIVRVPGGRASNATPSIGPPGSTPGSLVGQIRDALNGGRWLAALGLAILGGRRDEDYLTNLIFYARHPDRGGHPIRKDETRLAAEWRSVRDQLVRPALARTVAPSVSSPVATSRASSPAGPQQPISTTTAGPLAQARLGSLILSVPGKREFSYTFTPEDALWTAKLVVLEAGGEDDADSAAVIWAMFNRYALFTRSVFRTFADFVRAYSTTLQPILRNPKAAERHMNSPEFWRAGGTYAGTTVPRGQLKRHLKVQAQPWDEVRESARAITLRAMQGALANPVIGLASEFASTRIFWKVANRTKREPSAEEWRTYTERYARRRDRPARWIGDVAGIDQMKNAFFLDLRAAGLSQDTVRVVSP